MKSYYIVNFLFKNFYSMSKFCDILIDILPLIVYKYFDLLHYFIQNIII